MKFEFSQICPGAGCCWVMSTYAHKVYFLFQRLLCTNLWNVWILFYANCELRTGAKKKWIYGCFVSTRVCTVRCSYIWVKWKKLWSSSFRHLVQTLSSQRIAKHTFIAKVSRNVYRSLLKTMGTQSAIDVKLHIVLAYCYLYLWCRASQSLFFLCFSLLQPLSLCSVHCSLMCI